MRTNLPTETHPERATGATKVRTIVAALVLAASASAVQAADCRDTAEPMRDWSGCSRNNIVISGANLDRADLRKTDLSLSNLAEAVLTGANLESAKLTRTSLAATVADGANFMQVEGYRTDFSGMSAKGASFRGAELQRSSFAKATLTGVSFEKAELGRVDFTSAILGDNAFAFANLARANLKGVEIAGPLDFRGAYLFLTRIEGTDLSTATGLVQTQVDLACGDATTKLPGGLTPPAGWPCRFD